MSKRILRCVFSIALIASSLLSALSFEVAAVEDETFVEKAATSTGMWFEVAKENSEDENDFLGKVKLHSPALISFANSNVVVKIFTPFQGSAFSPSERLYLKHRTLLI